jgi:hypothetical protein
MKERCLCGGWDFHSSMGPSFWFSVRAGTNESPIRAHLRPVTNSEPLVLSRDGNQLGKYRLDSAVLKPHGESHLYEQLLQNEEEQILLTI